MWLSELISAFGEAVFNFTFYYPLFMSYLWMTGAIYYYFHWEKKGSAFDKPPRLPEYPGVSIIVPCHNEEDHIRETVGNLLKQQYPDFEVIVVNDGSTDNTGKILDELAEEHEILRTVHLSKNKGKAEALRMGAALSPNEYLICIDGDALLEPHATTWMIFHFLSGPRVGAVTGNPRIRTRSTLLGKVQVGEFSSIIGLIKRAQRVYGRIFTVSGVVAGFRKAALHHVGYWSSDTVTEDIDISWRLQLNFWDIRYEPNALCWILMPETLGGLWRQRVRWAQGGMETLLKYLHKLGTWKTRRMWPVYLEYAVSVVWAYTMAMVFGLWVLGKIAPLPADVYVPTVIPGWNGVILGMTCLAQFAVSLLIDSRYEKGIARYYYWTVWYPMLYWMLNVATTVVAAPKAVIREQNKIRGTWKSPDRGLRVKNNG